MNEWMNEWMNGWMDEWMNEWMNASRRAGTDVDGRVGTDGTDETDETNGPGTTRDNSGSQEIRSGHDGGKPGPGTTGGEAGTETKRAKDNSESTEIKPGRDQDQREEKRTTTRDQPIYKNICQLPIAPPRGPICYFNHFVDFGSHFGNMLRASACFFNFFLRHRRQCLPI